MKNFNDVAAGNLEKLEQFIPIVVRVHGENHPEIKKVQIKFNQLDEKIKNKDTNLEDEFSTLREITSNYVVPSDVCESYEAVYNMLEELDDAYHA